MAESFFGSLKQERVQWKNYQTRVEAQQDILNYISMFYNSQRLHSFELLSNRVYDQNIIRQPSSLIVHQPALRLQRLRY